MGPGVGWTRVGRWMGPAEYENMVDEGVVQWASCRFLPAQLHQPGASPWNPALQYRALYLTCDQYRSLCGATLWNAIWQAGHEGTALIPGAARSPAQALQALLTNTAISSNAVGTGAAPA